MFFGKKEIKCENCKSKIEDKFSYCPYCGFDMLKTNSKSYGLLGKNDFDNSDLPEDFSIVDKLVSSMMNNMVNSMVKNLDKQFKSMDKEFLSGMENTEIKPMPNGIKIRVGYPGMQQVQQKQKKVSQSRALTEEQTEKLSSLPRTPAKTSMKRLNNKIVYELKTQGVKSPEDIFISKTESGYEIKAIGEKKIYVNSIQVELPLRKLSLTNEHLVIEFNSSQN
jgi:hypothetical protein